MDIIVLLLVYSVQVLGGCGVTVVHDVPCNPKVDRHCQRTEGPSVIYCRFDVGLNGNMRDKTTGNKSRV